MSFCENEHFSGDGQDGDVSFLFVYATKEGEQLAA